MSTVNTARDPYEGSQFLKADKLIATLTAKDKKALHAIVKEVVQPGTMKDTQGQVVKEKCLAFEKTDKVLVLNITNYRILAMNFGDDEESWAGNKVTLVVRYGRWFNGPEGPAIRVWPMKPLTQALRKNFGTEQPSDTKALAEPQ